MCLMASLSEIDQIIGQPFQTWAQNHFCSRCNGSTDALGRFPADFALIARALEVKISSMALRDDDSSSTSFGWQRPALPNVAHFDLFSGAAGDMMLAACLVRKPFVLTCSSPIAASTTRILSIVSSDLRVGRWNRPVSRSTQERTAGPLCASIEERHTSHCR
jgi:hypothetical protein